MDQFSRNQITVNHCFGVDDVANAIMLINARNGRPSKMIIIEEIKTLLFFYGVTYEAQWMLESINSPKKAEKNLIRFTKALGYGAKLFGFSESDVQRAISAAKYYIIKNSDL